MALCLSGKTDLVITAEELEVLRRAMDTLAPFHCRALIRTAHARCKDSASRTYPYENDGRGWQPFWSVVKPTAPRTFQRR